MRSSGFVPLVLWAGSVLAARTENILNRRGTVPHDSLTPSAQKVQDNDVGRAIDRFNPLLHIAHGCQPYTAVNDAGDTSGGLKPSGKSDGGCKDTSKGQTYARAAAQGDKLAIMYAWYFPKDQPIDEVGKGSHRHDWEGIVVFLDNLTDPNPGIVGGAASGHGLFKKTTAPQREGDRVKVEYFTQVLFNHELQFTNTTGRVYPVLDWDAMQPAMQEGLTKTNFGSANVPFKDGNFESNLEKAAL